MPPILRQRLLMWMINSPAPVKSAPILLACAPEEWHEGSLLVIGSLLRRRRWPVAYLGQSVPLQDLSAFCREIQPSLLVVVAMTESSALALADWPRWMQDIVERGKPVFGYGGRIFVEQVEWHQKVSGIYLGDTFEQGVHAIEQVLSHTPN